MRKFFVFALIACLVPFAVGCKIDGLWGYDDNDPILSTTLAGNVVLNSTITAPSLGINATGVNPNLIAKNFQLSIGDQILNLDSATTSGTNTVLGFSKTASSTALGLTATTNSREVDVIIYYNGLPIYTFKMTVSGASSSESSDATNSLSISFSGNPDADGDGVLDDGVSLIISFTSPTGTFTLSATKQSLPAFYVTKQEVWLSDAWVPLGGSITSPTSLKTNSLNGLKFRVYFNKAATNLDAESEFSVTVNNLNTTGTLGQTITSGQGQIEVTPIDGNKSAELCLVNDHDLALSNAGLYKISINSTGLVSGTDELDSRAAAFFKTGL